MDNTGTVVEFSPAAERMFGYPRAEAIGRSLSELIVPPRYRAAHDAGLRRYAATGVGPLLDTHLRIPALRRDGREIDVEMVVSRVRHAGVDAFVGFLREVDTPPVVPADLLLRADLFRALVEHSPHLVTVVDSEGRSTYASPAAVALFGGTGGLLDEDRVHPEDRDAVRRTAPDRPVEARLRDRTGQWRAMSVQARDLRDEPAVTGTAYYATDASRARAAERRERVEYTRLLTLVESLKVGVLLQDAERRVVLANAAFVEMFEYADPAAGGRADEAVRAGRPAFGDEVALADGRILERDYVPIRLDGSTLGHLWVFRDVTTQAEARRTLQERNRILTELSQLKTEFVATVSHELRTPLTSIATFAEMLDLAGDPSGLDADERRSAVGAIRRNADRMLSLVADLLLLARLESGELALADTPVDLPLLVRESCAEAGPVPDGPPVTGDEDLLRELLTTAFGIVAGVSEHMTLTASVADAAWTIDAFAKTPDPVTTERLLSTRMPHPRYPGEHRTGALALMLARAIAARHGGNLSTSIGPGSVRVTITLPAAL